MTLREHLSILGFEDTRKDYTIVEDNHYIVSLGTDGIWMMLELSSPVLNIVIRESLDVEDLLEREDVEVNNRYGVLTVEHIPVD